MPFAPRPHFPSAIARRARTGLAAAAIAALTAGCTHPPAGPKAAAGAPAAALPAGAEAPPAPTPCPKGLPAAARCLSGQDSAGAHYLIAIPADWNGTLVLHAHGGPTLGAPRLSRTVEDLERWAVVPRAGYAWAGSTYRQGGVAVHAAAEDTERLRRIFVQHVAAPRMTLLHGQSWGASVAAVGASLFTDDGHGKRPYDGVLLTSGVLAGGSRAYDFRLDLRVIYQALCANHPLPAEPQYPLWMGLLPDATLKPADLKRRVDGCLGLDRPAAQRTAAQQSRVQTIVQTVRIRESAIHGHLNWATWHFQDIVQRRTGGANPFGNRGAVYTGSSDDAALNRSVQRYRADPQAVATFARDTDPDGRIPVPVLAVHGVDDPTAFVEMEDSFRRTMERAGTAGHLVQTFTADKSHSYLTDAAYPTLLAALGQWVRGGPAPTPAGIAAQCPGVQATFGGECRFLPGYRPQPLEPRVTPRERP
ncbi:hypothetical protein [Acidovorax sp. SUPP2825]|uniref:hypothetical protein n=1 Tax=Acidovorax sp. SUPP2825 TaxID=2920879 RepID=UPI0023DE4F7B|nr:hypothetical protein [Acidovorax sp. SUPP2825]GKS93155.1 alpha/beta hydrolase [Acidovorax sp. SUPP2825]